MSFSFTKYVMKNIDDEYPDEWYNRPLYYILHEEWERCCNNPKGDPENRCHLQHSHPKLIKLYLGYFLRRACKFGKCNFKI